MALLEVEVLKRSAIDRWRREVQHAVAQWHVHVDLLLGQRWQAILGKKVAAVRGAEGGHDPGRGDGPIAKHRVN